MTVTQARGFGQICEPERAQILARLYEMQVNRQLRTVNTIHVSNPGEQDAMSRDDQTSSTGFQVKVRIT